jgi:hypothetical protein
MIKSNYISYKDLSARVVYKDGKFFRYIFNSYKKEYDNLVNSGLYEELLKNNLIIFHEELFLDEIDENIYKIILPQQISFQSFPFEWSFQQWRKAILAFIKINQISLKYGMILKDATPYNFYFEAGNPVMFDTSSFIFFNENDKWIAYNQFCQAFLSPLALMHYNGAIWGKLGLSQLLGLPLQFVSKQLPIKSWFNLNVLFHIHLHSKYSFKGSNGHEGNNKGFSLAKLDSLFSLMKSFIFSWERPHLFKNYWDKYYEKDIETEQYITSKEQIIKNWLQSNNPDSVIDLGANTGRFSFIASNLVKNVISLESDSICVDEIVKQIDLRHLKNVSALVADLAEPSPSLGLMNMEIRSLFERAKCEAVMSLALIHHLYFTKDMSFAQIAELFSKFCTKFLIVEFIPNDDRKVKQLIETKPQRASGYNFESFFSSLSIYFEKLEEITLFPSSRILLLFKVK